MFIFAENSNISKYKSKQLLSVSIIMLKALSLIHTAMVVLLSWPVLLFKLINMANICLYNCVHINNY